MREVLRRQGKALSTEESYTHWLRRYIGAVTHMPEGLTSEQKLERFLERFLTDLAIKRDVAASTQIQAVGAHEN